MPQSGNENKKQSFKHYTLKNGLELIVEPILDVNSSAFSLYIPTGTAREPENLPGLANLMSECFHKGAGIYDSRQLSDECEKIGFHKSISCGMEAISFSGSVLADNFKRAFEITKMILLEPHFPESELESVKSLAIQDIDAIEDEPANKVMEDLNKEFYPDPFSRSGLGTKEGIEKITIEDIREFYKETFNPKGAVIGVSGRVDPDEIYKLISEELAGWEGGLEPLKIQPFSDKSRVLYNKKDNAQVQIALAYPSIGLDHPEYYAARVGVNVLSGGMSGRLFVEVREKRGLVYRVGASHSGARGRSAIFAYAGTTPENAEETLKVMLEQLNSLKDGLTEEELHRAKVDLKTRVIMQGESTSSRASSLASDWWNIGRVRSLDEVKSEIDKIGVKEIISYAKNFPVSGIALAVLGNKELSLGDFA